MLDYDQNQVNTDDLMTFYLLHYTVTVGKVFSFVLLAKY